MRNIVGRLATAAAVIAGALSLSPAAGASITPSLSLDQSAGTTAGAAANLGMDLKFIDTGTDSPHNLTIKLPPGLLANASIDGGACLKRANTSGTACEVGSGTVTATPDLIVLGLPASIPVPVTFYLVPPPEPGDLAGLTVIGDVLGVSEQLGSTGEIRVRPTGDPAGVGVTIGLVLPNQLTLSGLTVPLVTISVTQIQSTFNRLRYPATCPSIPAQLTASVDSYDDSGPHSLSAPLSVTRCSSLSYSPAFKVNAAKDTADRQVRLASTITQGAAEAPSRSVSLAFPTATLAPNLASIQALCLNLASGSCRQVGAASATSPLYPATLVGTAYLTGSPSGLSLTLVFPSPFPLTLTGTVNLLKNAATFAGLPDIPLTDLTVTLNGGTEGLFLSTCNTPSGTATATLTDQAGDKTATVPATFAVSGCPGVTGSGGSDGSGGRGSGSSPTSGGGSQNASSASGVTLDHVRLSRARFAGLRAGRPTLSFRVNATRGAAKLRALTVGLPAGPAFIAHHHRLAHISVYGAKVKSLSLAHGRLVISLRRPVSTVSVTVSRGALSESRTLRAKAEKRTLNTLGLTVIAQTTRGRRITFHARVDDLDR
ncbi:MAG TPA: hypothetical protein VHV28_12475 [Solirubrobacteraceae bacterium]|nr:hypothetical protein [Solirubrobacteraceae bacterium]